MVSGAQPLTVPVHNQSPFDKNGRFAPSRQSLPQEWANFSLDRLAGLF